MTRPLSSSKLSKEPACTWLGVWGRASIRVRVRAGLYLVRGRGRGRGRIRVRGRGRGRVRAGRHLELGHLLLSVHHNLQQGRGGDGL